MKTVSGLVHLNVMRIFGGNELCKFSREMEEQHLRPRITGSMYGVIRKLASSSKYVKINYLPQKVLYKAKSTVNRLIPLTWQILVIVHI